MAALIVKGSALADDANATEKNSDGTSSHRGALTNI
jgi:hypothetical protein